MPKTRVILELGSGNDLHGSDYTKAALRAVQDALHHSSLTFVRALKIDKTKVDVDVTIGVQRPERVDLDKIKQSLPLGNLTVKAVKGGLDPRGQESVWRALFFARRAAEQARRAAEHAGAVAARQERIAGRQSASARVHANIAAMHRKSEACQRAAERMHLDFSRRLTRWALRGDADLLLRPVLMSAVANTAGWHGAVLSLRDSSGDEMLVAASDATARRAHELEVTLNEGPSWDALLGGNPVACGDELDRRWPSYAPAVGDLGVQAVAAVPLDLGSRNLGGALTVSGAQLPSLTDDACGLSDVAEALARTVLQVPDVIGTDAFGVPRLNVFEEEDFQPVLHQATGLLHAKYGWDMDNALALIRAHAFAEDRPIADVAADI